MSLKFKQAATGLAAWAMAAGAASAATAADVRAVFADACPANGIDPGPCACIVDGVIGAHGVDATMALGLDMVLRYDEAEAMRAQVGEDAVFAAGDTFDVLQNTSCSGAALADAPPASAGPVSASDAATAAETPR